ncbi:hypothetical protein AAVH_20620 [Aphelenchoides avenae]|nr:hypothetical protein AAVH_20620 [Aphelenchus avenae]
MTVYGDGGDDPSWYQRVGHVGIEVKTVDGGKYTIHNPGKKGRESPDAVAEPFAECDGKRVRSTKLLPKRVVTVGELLRKAGTDYNFFTNNCYHARNRILRYIGADIRHCPNPMDHTSDRRL